MDKSQVNIKHKEALDIHYGDGVNPHGVLQEYFHKKS